MARTVEIYISTNGKKTVHFSGSTNSEVEMSRSTNGENVKMSRSTNGENVEKTEEREKELTYAICYKGLFN